jgi:hypothetical protein
MGCGGQIDPAEKNSTTGMNNSPEEIRSLGTGSSSGELSSSIWNSGAAEEM